MQETTTSAQEIYEEALAQAWSGLSPGAQSLFVHIGESIERGASAKHRAVAALAKNQGVSRRTIRRELRELSQAGLLSDEGELAELSRAAGAAAKGGA